MSNPGEEYNSTLLGFAEDNGEQTTVVQHVTTPRRREEHKSFFFR